MKQWTKNHGKINILHKKKTGKTEFTDHSSNDKDTPIVQLDYDTNVYKIVWKGTEIGTKYTYKIQAFHNSNAQEPIGESEPKEVVVQTGIMGYY